MQLDVEAQVHGRMTPNSCADMAAFDKHASVDADMPRNMLVAAVAAHTQPRQRQILHLHSQQTHPRQQQAHLLHPKAQLSAAREVEGSLAFGPLMKAAAEAQLAAEVEWRPMALLWALRLVQHYMYELMSTSRHTGLELRNTAAIPMLTSLVDDIPTSSEHR